MFSRANPLNSGGTEPDSAFPAMYSLSKLESLPSSGGSKPVSLFALLSRERYS